MTGCSMKLEMQMLTLNSSFVTLSLLGHLMYQYVLCNLLSIPVCIRFYLSYLYVPGLTLVHTCMYQVLRITRGVDSS